MKRYSWVGAGVILAVLLGILMFSEREVPEKLIQESRGLWNSLVHSLEPEAPREEYGIEVGDMYLCTDVIRPNENLSEILSRNGIPYQIIHELSQKSSAVFDLRKLKAGKSYCIMRSQDSLAQVEYFIYEQDPVNYVVYDLKDTVRVTKGRKEVTRVPRSGVGHISSSLWNTLTENQLDPELAIRMSEIYAWSIDFFRLHKGDYFKLLFEEKYVEGRSIGAGDIQAALFHHAGKDFYAIRYAQNGEVDFFDKSANSLRKAFLRAPLQFRRISSRFNRRRFHPVLKRRRPHLGTDYAAAPGTPIWSIGDGVVTEARYSRGGGNYVAIRHNGTYTTRYLHMSKFGPGIRKGVRVTQGQVIGYVGSTGLATGPHLHYEMIQNGKHVDAQSIDIPPGDPIAPEHQEAYAAHRDEVVARLDALPIPGTYTASQGEPANGDPGK
ncbi:MAG: peptidoglycan DD-metalloendopeptidase family protein [Bacteroidota bacterium]